MGETLLLVTIITLVVLTIRRARPVVLDSPVIIQRSGQFHITLAPQLNRAQSFIEKIAKQFRLLHSRHTDIPTQYFIVRDAKVFAKGKDFYLLAITLRDNTLFFQALNPELPEVDAVGNLKALLAFVEKTLAQCSQSSQAITEDASEICASVESAALQMNIDVKVLQTTS